MRKLSKEDFFKEMRKLPGYADPTHPEYFTEACLMSNRKEIYLNIKLKKSFSQEVLILNKELN